VRDRLDRLRDLAGEWSLFIDAALAAYGAHVIAHGLIWSFVFDRWSHGLLAQQSGPPPRLDLALDDGIAELVILVVVMLALPRSTSGHGARLQLAAAGVFGIAILPNMFVFDLWNNALCDQGDFIAHCVAQSDATHAAIAILAGAIAGAVYVYRVGFGLPAVAAILVAIPSAVIALQPGYAEMIWREGPWAFLAMLGPILGGVAMVVSTLAYRRVRGR
jgi:hypothetical protein